MDDSGGALILVFVAFIGAWLLGLFVDSNYKFLQERIKWAEEVCKDHKGPDSIDTSWILSAEVTCADGVEIEDGKK